MRLDSCLRRLKIQLRICQQMKDVNAHLFWSSLQFELSWRSTTWTWVSFDQGRTGHERRKPTSLVTNLPGMVQLDGLRGGGSTDGVGPYLQDRIRCSKTWAAWSPGLVAAIQESLKAGTHLIKEMAEQDHMQMKKMDMGAWK